MLMLEPEMRGALDALAARVSGTVAVLDRLKAMVAEWNPASVNLPDARFLAEAWAITRLLRNLGEQAESLLSEAKATAGAWEPMPDWAARRFAAEVVEPLKLADREVWAMTVLSPDEVLAHRRRDPNAQYISIEEI